MIHGAGEYQTREDPTQKPVGFTINPNPLVAAIGGVPRLGFNNFVQSVVALLQHRHGVVRASLLDGLWWEKNVSIGIQKTLEGDFKREHGRDPDYFLFLDYDSVFTPQQFDAALKFMQEHPEFAAAFPVQMSRHNERPLCNEPFLDYTGEFTEKTFGHFGMTIIRREVFEQLPKPWLFAQPGQSGDWDDPTSVDSDIMFWRLLKDHGYRACQLNKVVLGHLELCVIWPKHNAPQYQTIGDYRKYGAPSDAVWSGRPLNPNPKVVKLNLGAGRVVKPGFFSIDRKDQQEVFPLPYADNSVDEVYASHVLEHFSHTQRFHVLYEWVRVLKPGGKITICVPDFRRLSAAYLADEPPKNVEQWILGGHIDGDDVHGAIYDEKSLRGIMLNAGLENVVRVQNNENDTSRIQWSLNLEATKTKVNLWSVDSDAMADEVAVSVYGAAPTTPPNERPHEDFDWLRSVVKSGGPSQFGEHSILEAIADELGLGVGWAFEVGAGDGVSGSNTVWCRNREWPTVMIEADTETYQKLKEVPRIVPINCKIGPTGPKSIDTLLDGVGAPEDIHLGVIDIDSDDYHVARAMRRRPKILMVEFRNTGGRPANKQIPPIGFGQATQPAIVELGREMGYEFVATTMVNAIFVRADVAGALRRRANPIVDLRCDGDTTNEWSQQDNHLLMAAGAD